MVPIIQAFTNLFAPIFEYFGLSKEISQVLSAIVSTLLLIGFVALVRALYKRWKIAQVYDSLQSYWEKPDIQKARLHFIDTQMQNIAPNKEEAEPGDSRPYVAKEKLIPFFLNHVFDNNKRSDKYHLVLAGSGMGKTTFMLNLYMSYHSFFSETSEKVPNAYVPFQR